MTAPGSTPWERHSAASDTITANSAGCTTSTRSSDGPRPFRTSRSDQSTNGAKAASHASIEAANTGEAPAARRPCPPTASPGPGRRTRRGRRARSPRAAARRVPPAISASRPASSAVGGRRPTTAARSARWARPVASENADVGERRVGLAARCSRSRSRLRHAGARRVAAGARASGTTAGAARADVDAARRRLVDSAAPPRARRGSSSRWRRTTTRPRAAVRSPAGQASASLSSAHLSRRPVDVRAIGDEACSVLGRTRAAAPAPS